MQYRPLGRTGIDVSVLGYGAFKIGRTRGHRFPRDYELPSDRDVERLLNAVLDAGITLIDTAPAYGLSEQRIGRVLGPRRDEIVLATKVGESFSAADGSSFDFSAAAVRSSIERSLRELQTDRLDLACVHSNGNDLEVQQQTDVIKTLQDLKRRGLVRAIGFSGKTAGGSQAAVDWADVLMLTRNQNNTSQTGVIAGAAAAGCGVIVKKGLDSGRLPVEAAIPFVLDQVGVSSLLIGTLSLQNLATNVALVDSLCPTHNW